MQERKEKVKNTSTWKAAVSYQGWQGRGIRKPVVQWLPVHISGPEIIDAASPFFEISVVVFTESVVNVTG